MGSHATSYGLVDALHVGRYSWAPSTQVVCYRIGHTLIDTGPPNQWSAVQDWVAQQHATHGIEQVVVTHHHEDHSGNAGRIAEWLDVPVYAPEASLERLENGFSIELYRWVVWGRPRPITARPFPEGLPLGDGTNLRAIAAPGHADDMVCYWAEAHGLLWTADLYISRRPEYLRFDEHVHTLIRSLHRVLSYDFDTVLCGHRGRIPEGRMALREKARYLEALCGVVARRRRSDKQGITGIRNEILGREGWLYWISGGDFSKRNLITSCLASDAEQEHVHGEIVRSSSDIAPSHPSPPSFGR